jgi:hypothetical protein
MFGTRPPRKAAPSVHRLGFESLENRITMSAAPVASPPLATDEITPTQAPAALLSVEDWVHSLAYYQFNLLTADQVQYLTPQQVASIPQTSYLGAMAPAARAALNQTQVQSLDVARVDVSLLSSQQIGWLTATQIQQVRYYELFLLSPAQMKLVTPTQVAAIPSASYLAEWSPTARAALGVAQVQALNTAKVDIGLLTDQQLGWLTAAQIQGIRYYELYRLSPAQIASVTATQIATVPTASHLWQWSAEARGALNQTQVAALNVAATGIGMLTSQQAAWLTAAQVQRIKFYELWQLSPAQIPLLAASQLAAIPAASYLWQWSPAARGALTQTQVANLDIAATGISMFASRQIAWLTGAQIRQVSVQELSRLIPAQIPLLTTAQIASIPTVGHFAEWSPAARAALTLAQLQAIDVGVIGIGLLTAGQIDWLTPAQIREVAHYDMQLLNPSQIPNLTVAQIAAIPSGSYVWQWTPAARAALTIAQVQSLNMDIMEVGLLTPQQVFWLSESQVQKVRYYELELLSSLQIPMLTAAQIASLPAPSYLGEWSAAARAALTLPQVQSLNVPVIGISLLTPQQVAWLTPAQVRQVAYPEFRYLTAGQVPYLTLEQVASIPSASYLAEWTPAARAALTYAQVRSLDVPSVGIGQLTSAQIGWLTLAQLRAVNYEEFQLLSVAQIPLLSLAQVSAIPSSSYLSHLPDALLAAFTRPQMLSLSTSVIGELTTEYEQTPPSNYHDIGSLVVGPDGLPTNGHMAEEAARVFALVPIEAATHVTVASGSWSDPRVWRNGVVPAAGAKVLVSAGTTVQFDAYMNFAISTLRIDGTLSFAVNRNTQLKVDTVVVYTTGKLHIGTAAAPIQDNVTARVLIADNGPINTTWDPYQFSRGVVSRGEVRMYGKTVTPYVPLAVDPSAGDTQLYLREVPVNWRVGDKLVIAGTYPTVDGFGTDEVTIRAINGVVVTVDRLTYDHHTPENMGRSVHVANTSRNVILAAEDASVVAERPHMAFIHNPNVVLSGISVQGFGRTDKSVPINDPIVVNGVLQPGTGTNVRARYAIHFHHTGVNPAYAPAVVVGSVVEGSPGWGYVNHQSNVIFENNVAMGVKGAAFVTEDGNEIGEMRRNFAINTTGTFDNVISRRGIHDFGFRGNGFWLQGPGVSMIENIAAGSQDAGFVYFTSSGKVLFDAANLDDPTLAAGKITTPVGMVPLKASVGNTAYASKTGMEIWFHQTSMTDGESVIDQFTSWNSVIAGIDVWYSGHVTVRDALLINQDFKGTGISSNSVTHDLAVVNCNILGFEIGIDAPVRRSTAIWGGYISAVTGVFIEKGHDSIRSVDIGGPITFAPLTSSQLLGRTQYRVFLSGEMNPEEFNMRKVESLVSSDRIRYAPAGSAPLALYYVEQYPYYIPFRSGAVAGYVPDEYLGKTNMQLKHDFGVMFGGRLTPTYSGAPLVRGFANPTF